MAAKFLILKNSSYRDGAECVFDRNLPNGKLASAHFTLGPWGVPQHATDDGELARAFAFAGDGRTPIRDFSVYNLANKDDCAKLTTRQAEVSLLSLPAERFSVALLPVGNSGFVRALRASEELRRPPRQHFLAILDAHLHRITISEKLAALEARLDALDGGGGKSKSATKKESTPKKNSETPDDESGGKKQGGKRGKK